MPRPKRVDPTLMLCVNCKHSSVDHGVLSASDYSGWGKGPCSRQGCPCIVGIPSIHWTTISVEADMDGRWPWSCRCGSTGDAATERRMLSDAGRHEARGRHAESIVDLTPAG